ncbi:hypothetical protein Hesp01_74580 [Herbidospora sp. NBRC 101105]|nr:hypothetical protein Hesp01_74580 [Herbidospora sp. NBRC 101105]
MAGLVPLAQYLYHHMLPGHAVGQQVPEVSRCDKTIAPVKGDGGVVARDHREFQRRGARLQRRPQLISCFLAKTRLDFKPP